MYIYIYIYTYTYTYIYVYIYIYIYIYIYPYISNLLFTIIKFQKKNGENSIVIATIVGKLPLCLICPLEI